MANFSSEDYSLVSDLKFNFALCTNYVVHPDSTRSKIQMIFLLSYFCIPSYLNRLGGNPLLTAPVKEPLDILASKPTDTEGCLLNNFGKFQFYFCVHINLG